MLEDMLQYSWRINVGNRVTIAGGLDTVELPSGYRMEEARLFDGREIVYLMKDGIEIHNWLITNNSPRGYSIIL